MNTIFYLSTFACRKHSNPKRSILQTIKVHAPPQVFKCNIRVIYGRMFAQYEEKLKMKYHNLYRGYLLDARKAQHRIQ